MAELDEMRQKCWQETVHCFGTSYVFGVRANLLRRRLRILTFLGIVVPASVGAAVTSFGAGSQMTAIFLGIASVLGLVQLIGSIWSLSNRWEDDFAYAQESLSANRQFAESYRQLAADPPGTIEQLKSRLTLIDAENNARSTADERQGITDNEKRMGMRAALRQLQKACAACKETPTSMKPSNCDICGNFHVRRF